MTCASTVLAIARQLPPSDLQEWIRLCSCCLGTQLKTATLYSTRLHLTPMPPAPCIFPALQLPRHHHYRGPNPFRASFEK